MNLARAKREKLIERPTANSRPPEGDDGPCRLLFPNRRTMGLRYLHDVGDLALGDTFRLLQALLVSDELADTRLDLLLIISNSGGNVEYYPALEWSWPAVISHRVDRCG